MIVYIKRPLTKVHCNGESIDESSMSELCLVFPNNYYVSDLFRAMPTRSICHWSSSFFCHITTTCLNG